MNLWIKHIQESYKEGEEAAGKEASPGKKTTEKSRGGSGIFGKRKSKNLEEKK